MPSSGLVTGRGPVKSLPLHFAGGRKTNLTDLLRGGVTAVQLIFTGCNSTCLTQGAMFAQLQERLKDRAIDGRLLSISIDPLGDDVAVLGRWLRKYNQRSSAWVAGVPDMRNLDRLFAEFRVASAEEAVSHLNRVCLFDRQATMFWVSRVDPNVEEIVGQMAGRISLAPSA